MKINKIFSTAIILSMLTVITVEAAENSIYINSKGNIKNENGSTTMNGDEIIYLYDEYLNSTNLVSKNKSDYFNTLNSLNNINVFNENSISFNGISNNITNTQNVDQTPITVNNLTYGTAGWVEGNYIIGNGNDNQNSYNDGSNKGDSDARNETSNGGGNISYTRHVHVNGSGVHTNTSPIYTTTAPGGCYVASGHTHHKTGSCPSHESSVYDPNGNGHMRYSTSGNDPGDQTGGSTCWCGETCDGWDAGGGYKIYSCPNFSYYRDVTVYDCGNYINTWVLGCGKTEGRTVDKAYITFD